MNSRYFYILWFLLCLFIIISCKKVENTRIVDVLIDKGWKFKNASDSNWLPAKVPGDVLTDLLNNHKISDPFFRKNEKQIYPLELADWVYSTQFNIDPKIFSQDEIQLYFEGLDTYSDIYLNDSLILQTNNMFRSWTINCKTFIHFKDNRLRIIFHSPVKIGLEKLGQNRYPLPTMEEQAPEEKQTSPFTRKASFQYGFDGGPRLLNAGIWKPIHLIGWSSCNISDIYLQPKLISKEVARYNAICSITSIKSDNITIELDVNKKLVVQRSNVSLKKGENLINISFAIENPNLWWTNTIGSPYLYNVDIKLYSKNIIIDEKHKLLGVRTIELVQKPDSIGTSFYFKLNGVPVFMKGANYVPTNALLSRNNQPNYKRIISDAVNSNMNMLRIWGGGIYENDSFYDYCDSLGILVWQDFMFASSMLPGDKATIENVRQEALENVKRLRNHACIALWCGNSELQVDWQYLWKNNYPKDQADIIQKSNDSIFNNVLKNVVNIYDEQTPYWVSSPSVENDKLPDSNSGDEHDWSVWYNGASFEGYGDNPGRFVSEYGVQSFPSITSLNKSTIPTDLKFKSEIIDWKQRNTFSEFIPYTSGNDIINKYILANFKSPTSFERFVFLSQISQSIGLQTAIQHHRINKPKNMGSLLWQFNDCWPGITWSTIDFYGNWKPAAYTVKESFKPIVIIPELEDYKINITAVNDLLIAYDAILMIKLIDFKGSILFVKQIPVKIPANKSTLLISLKEKDVLGINKLNTCCLLTQLNLPSKTLDQNILYFAEPKKLLLPLPKIDIKVNEAVKGYNIILKSDVFVRNVFLETHNKPCIFPENNIELLPGKRVKINVHYDGTKDQLLNDLKIQYL